MFKDYKEKNNNVTKVYKRRTPSQSEITLEELKKKSGLYLVNKIRMLQDPYPNPFIITKDKKKS